MLSEEAVLGFEYGYLDDRPGHAGHLGRPVRRLRQRRAGHHRPVHHLRRSEVGPPVRADAVPAARLRGPGSGALLGAARALPAAVRREQHTRSACRRRRRRCSTCCAGRCCAALRKPLIVMTPKSLLRHKLSVSALEELTHGHFQNVIDEVDPIEPAKVRRVVLCSGKVYYDLLEQRRRARDRGRRAGPHRAAVSVPVRRVRRDHRPLPATRARSSGARKSRRTRAPGTRSAIACRSHSGRCTTLLYAGRPGAAAPAAGIFQLHVEQQRDLVEAALSSTATEEPRIATRRA